MGIVQLRRGRVGATCREMKRKRPGWTKSSDGRRKKRGVVKCRFMNLVNRMELYLNSNAHK